MRNLRFANPVNAENSVTDDTFGPRNHWRLGVLELWVVAPELGWGSE